MGDGWFETVAEAQRRAGERLPASGDGAPGAGSEKGPAVADQTAGVSGRGAAPRCAGVGAMLDLDTPGMVRLGGVRGRGEGAAGGSGRLGIQDRFKGCPTTWSSDSAPGPVRASGAALHPSRAGYSKPPLLPKKPLSTCIEEATIIVPATAALAPGVASPTARSAPPPASPRPAAIAFAWPGRNPSCSNIFPVCSRPAPPNHPDSFCPPC